MDRTVTFSGDEATLSQRAYAQFIEREFYAGVLDVEVEGTFCLSIDKALRDPINLQRMVSNASISFRRSRSDIRRNNPGSRVLWFVNKGEFQIVQPQNSLSIAAGEWGVLDTSVPFYARAITDGQEFDIVCVVVPGHLFYSHLTALSGLNVALKFDTRDQTISKLLRYICEFGEKLGATARSELIKALFASIADCTSRSGNALTSRQRLAKMNFERARECIATNYRDLSLTHVDVAEKCGISTRYLMCLLNKEGTTYSKVLWGLRLNCARAMLLDPAMAGLKAIEIARRSGFKTQAHFCRSFKAAYGVAPGRFREESMPRQMATSRR